MNRFVSVLPRRVRSLNGLIKQLAGDSLDARRNSFMVFEAIAHYMPDHTTRTRISDNRLQMYATQKVCVTIDDLAAALEALAGGRTISKVIPAALITDEPPPAPDAEMSEQALQ
jgi:hypothetical protein